MVRGRDAVVLRVLQLRGPAGGVFGVPPAPGRDAPGQAAIGNVGLVLCAGVWDLRTVCGKHRGPCAAQIGGAVGSEYLEHHLHGHRSVAEFPPTAGVSRGRRLGRDLLLPGFHVPSERLSRAPVTLARHGLASDQRVRGYDRRRFLRRADQPAVRMAILVRCVRRNGRNAWVRHP